MEQRDFLMDEIEKFAKAIGKIIADFLGLKTEGKVSQGIRIANESLKSELDIDIEKILNSKIKDLDNYLNNKKIPSESLEKLVDYITEIGEHTLLTDKNKGLMIYERALDMMKTINANSNVFSFERMQKIEKLNNLIKENNK